jgi:protein-S-isoprenylcysteine O-methyltransferase Ste14
MPGPRAERLGGILVLLQFVCIAVLVFGGGWLLPWWAWALFAIGIIVFLLAGSSLGNNNLTVMPAPRKGNSLSKRGIYRLVRHPMYLSVLFCGAAVALGAPSTWRWAALVAVVFDLVLKIRHEERHLTALHPEYPQVMKGVARLLPGVW